MKRKIFLLTLTIYLFCTNVYLNAQWVNTDGLGAKSVNIFASLEQNIYMGGSGNIYRSTNNGLVWSQNLSAWNGARAICVDRGRIFTDDGNRISRSIDNGETWVPVTNNNDEVSIIYDFVFWNNYGIAATLDGILHSANNGNTWSLLRNSLFQKSVQAVVVLGDHIYAGTTYSGVYYSEDNGYTWTNIGTGLEGYLIALKVVDTNLVAVMETGVYISVNNGENWSKINNNLPVGIEVSSIAVSDYNIYIGSNSGVYKSTNNGADWAKISTGLPPEKGVTAVAVCNSNLYAGVSGNGIYRSTNDGAEWKTANYGFPSTANITDISISGDNFLASSQHGAFISNREEIFWSNLDFPADYGEIKDLIKFGDAIYAGSWYYGVFRTVDNGLNWVQVNNGLTNEQIFSFAAVDTTLFAATYGGGVFKYIKNSSSWVPVNNGLSNLNMRSLLAIGNDLLAGTYNKGVYLSTDFGATWVPRNSGLPAGDVLRGFAVSGNNIYAGMSDGGVYVSNNNQIEWTHITKTGFSSELLVSVAATDDYIFAGSWGEGIYCMPIGGTKWTQINTGLTGYDVYRINALAIYNDKILAGTNGCGIWMRSLSEIYTNVEDVILETPTNYILNQNYPNPFNPSTTISFSLPAKEFVTLKIYDALGKEVTTLVNEELNAGSYKNDWNAGNLSSGIYFYRLQAGKYSETRKLILLK